MIFDLLRLRNPSADFFIKLETYNYLQLSPDSNVHAKFDFDLTTWVVCTNSQFDTKSLSFLVSSACPQAALVAGSPPTTLSSRRKSPFGVKIGPPNYNTYKQTDRQTPGKTYPPWRR